MCWSWPGSGSCRWRCPVIPSGFGLIRPAAVQYDPAPFPGGQDPGGVDPFGQMPGDDMDMPLPGRSRSKAARKKAAAREGGEQEGRREGHPRPRGRPRETVPADSGGLKFSQDIAPILVANCIGCHSKDGPGVRRGKLDLSTFEKLQDRGRPITRSSSAGKPEESHLVHADQRRGGAEDAPGRNNRALSAEAIAKITRWVKEGARLDAGIDPKVGHGFLRGLRPSSCAASSSPRRRRRSATSKVIEAGQARWKQSDAKQKAEVVPGTHFIVFSNLPSDRATSTLKAMETQYGHLKRLLGPPAMDWPEKVSLYVFNGKNEFIEFVRSVEGREVDAQEPRLSVRFNVPQPYIAAVDPAGGKKEEPRGDGPRGRRRRSPRARAAERTLLGLLTEGLGSGSVAVAGNAPRWLREGIGTFMAAAVEPRSPYYRQLRQTAFQDFDQGWQTKATQALGRPAHRPRSCRAVSFALVECMMRSEFGAGLPGVPPRHARGRPGGDSTTCSGTSITAPARSSSTSPANGSPPTTDGSNDRSRQRAESPPRPPRPGRLLPPRRVRVAARDLPGRRDPDDRRARDHALGRPLRARVRRRRPCPSSRADGDPAGRPARVHRRGRHPRSWARATSGASRAASPHSVRALDGPAVALDVFHPIREDYL